MKGSLGRAAVRVFYLCIARMSLNGHQIWHFGTMAGTQGKATLLAPWMLRDEIIVGTTLNAPYKLVEVGTFET